MKFTNPPQPRERTYYRVCEEEFLDIASRYDDIVAVYNAGTVSAPGISDLDFIIVLRDTLTGSLDIEQHLTDRLRDIMAGASILKVPEGLAISMRVIDDFPLQHVAGKVHKFENFDTSWHELCRVLDWLPERLHTLVQLHRQGEVDIRYALGFLKSLTVSLDKLDDIIKRSYFRSFTAAVHEVRSQWFRRRHAEDLLQELLVEAVPITTRALNCLNDWLLETSYVMIPTLPSGVRFTIDSGPRFTFELGADDDDEVAVPMTVATFLAAQSQVTDGFIAQKITHSFSYPPADVSRLIHPELAVTIKARQEYVEALVDFFRRNHLQRGLLKYGWYLKAHVKA